MSYAYQAVVTVPAASGSDQTNITVALTGSDTKLKTVANGGQIQHTVTRVGQTVPADLILSSDAGGTSLYNWGVESYDAVNGTVVIWVKIPTHSHTASTSIYVSIGDSGVSTYQGGSKGAEYDANTQGVYHLPNGASLSALNFAAAGTNWGDGTAVNTPSVATGKIDGGMSVLNTSGQGQGASIALTGTTTTALTARGWAKTSTSQTMHMFSTWGGSGGNEKFYLAVVSNKLQAAVSTASAVTANGTTTLTDGNWHMVGLSWSTVGTLTAYTDGSAQGTGSTGATSLNFTAGSPYIGRDLDESSFWFTGSLDECRVDYVLRSADWLATEYANQSSPPSIGTFSALAGGAGTARAIVRLIT